MYKLKSAGFAVLAAGACLALNVMSANAAEAASLSSCVDQARQVQTALDANPQAANHADAAKEQRYGREFCNSGFYQRGVAHYAQALKLLGADKS